MIEFGTESWHRGVLIDRKIICVWSSVDGAARLHIR